MQTRKAVFNYSQKNYNCPNFEYINRVKNPLGSGNYFMNYIYQNANTTFRVYYRN